VSRTISDRAQATAAGLPAAETCALEAKTRFDRLFKGADEDILPIRRHLIGGSPGDGIPKLARRLRANIVVAGSASRAGLQRLLIGNTSERRLSSLHCHLLVLKPAQSCNRVPTESHGPRFITCLPAW
jgi:nucleotide-binding universal stress UspA family protein